MSALVAALTAVVVLLVVLVVGLLRSHAEILRALHELGLDDVLDPAAPSSPASIRTRPGVAAPRPGGTRAAADVVGATPDGGMTSVAVVDVEHHTLLAFLSSGCLTCHTFWEAFADPHQRALPGMDTRLVVVTRDPDAESPARLVALAPRGVTTVLSSKAWDDYDVPVAPYFLLVDGPSGSVVGEGAASTWEQVRDLLGQAMGDAGHDRRGRRREAGNAAGAARQRRIDDELARAGIEPGDPRLYLPRRGEDGPPS